MLFSEPKIPQSKPIECPSRALHVSVLFSEPKIPQYDARLWRYKEWSMFQCSSASRKFLNNAPADAHFPALVFQCSSASRKFLNRQHARRRSHRTSTFQCSSASRKFLNHGKIALCIITVSGFSALQRAENSSIIRLRAYNKTAEVSVLFSEPKIPQSVV